MSSNKANNPLGSLSPPPAAFQKLTLRQKQYYASERDLEESREAADLFNVQP